MEDNYILTSQQQLNPPIQIKDISSDVIEKQYL